ncbi:CBS domain-containing protein [Candidatus Woesearchaeota archaeon]|nr:CBS domain-containing protein [Candidatus Woesearchaeota archaeon]
MKVADCRLEEPLSCERAESIIEVARKLRQNKVRHIVVVDNEKPVGIVAAVDIVNNVIAEGSDYKQMKAADVMISPIFVVDRQDEVATAYFGMVKRNTYSCPVVDNGKFVGMITMSEALKAIAKSKIPKEA